MSFNVANVVEGQLERQLVTQYYFVRSTRTHRGNPARQRRGSAPLRPRPPTPKSIPLHLDNLTTSNPRHRHHQRHSTPLQPLPLHHCPWQTRGSKPRARPLAPPPTPTARPPPSPNTKSRSSACVSSSRSGGCSSDVLYV